jgi:thiamine monophosphate kinase
MTDVLTLTALNLRARASRHRAEAATAASDGLADELIALAADYEQDASRLEARLAVAKKVTRFELN